LYLDLLIPTYNLYDGKNCMNVKELYSEAMDVVNHSTVSGKTE